ncbi:MAG: hypothetical protein HY319_25685 [Armatimonadetes bacterium]|nr:hypothetical protein [Armatimonadota bacterium]
MALCPLLQKECLRNECQWWAGGIQTCTVVALGMMLERVHDMGANAYNQWLTPPEVE